MEEQQQHATVPPFPPFQPQQIHAITDAMYLAFCDQQQGRLPSTSRLRGVLGFEETQIIDAVAARLRGVESNSIAPTVPASSEAPISAAARADETTSNPAVDFTPHSPAPWRVQTSEGLWIEIHDARGGWVASIRGDTNARYEANGRLIAAAPHLLEACRFAADLQQMAYMAFGNTQNDVLDRRDAGRMLAAAETLIRTAVERATGQWPTGSTAPARTDSGDLVVRLGPSAEYDNCLCTCHRCQRLYSVSPLLSVQFLCEACKNT